MSVPYFQQESELDGTKCRYNINELSFEIDCNLDMNEPNLYPTRPAVAREKTLREKLKEQSLQIQVLVDEIERLRSSTSETNNNNENIDLQNNKFKMI